MSKLKIWAIVAFVFTMGGIFLINPNSVRQGIGIAVLYGAGQCLEYFRIEYLKKIKK